MITPFLANGAVDYPSLEKIINHLVTGGIDYIVALGTTGETATISDKERFEILDFILEKTNDRIPIVAGFGGNDTKHVIWSINEYDCSRFAAILSVCPYYNKPNQNGIYQHYAAIAQNTDCPIILYNVPGRTGINVSADTCIRLAKDFDNIVAMKEASGDLQQCMDIYRGKPEDFLLISGDDAFTLPFISIGMDGLISVIGNAYPKAVSSMVNEALNANYSAAKKTHYNLLPLMNMIFEEGSPSGIKVILEHLNLGSQDVRLPVAPVGDALRKRILAEVSRFESTSK
ncbi:UNVERIFIED_CONTAM: hypothetical protein GTU68_005144 [Idotea baltica]|nr:hypothetical protein [Idotea baltica]